jgi:hypothetical protein
VFFFSFSFFFLRCSGQRLGSFHAPLTLVLLFLVVRMLCYPIVEQRLMNFFLFWQATSAQVEFLRNYRAMAAQLSQMAQSMMG